LEIFQSQLSIDDFWSHLDSSEEFRRGLPRPDDLQKPFIAQVLRKVLANNQVADQDVEDEDVEDEDEAYEDEAYEDEAYETYEDKEPQLQNEKDALKLCFRNGWLHATTDKNDIPVYIFATPLHKGFVEYYLGN